MPFTTAGHNALLDGQSAAGITHVAAYNGDPEGAGTVSSTARQPIAWAAASGSSKGASGQPELAIGAGNTVNYIGFYTALTGGELRAKAAVTAESFGGAGTYKLNTATLALS